MFLSNLRSKESNILCQPLFFCTFFLSNFLSPSTHKNIFLAPQHLLNPFLHPISTPYFFSFSLPSFKKTPRPLPSFNAFKQKFFCPISAQLSWLVLIMDDLLVYPFLKPEIPPLERSLLNYPSLKLVDSIFGQIFLRFSFRKILLLRAKTVFPC